jgi:sulfur-oxidizing protein SoxY
MRPRLQPSDGDLSRRSLLAGAVGILVLPLGSVAEAAPEDMAEAMAEALGKDAPIKPGRIKIELPQLAENGNSVPLKIAVESPMSAADHVKTIFIFSERNPVPNVVRFHLGPRSGAARVQTSIRLAGTQRITAVARMSDGSLWSGGADVIVTQAACLDDT